MKKRWAKNFFFNIFYTKLYCCAVFHHTWKRKIFRAQHARTKIRGHKNNLFLNYITFTKQGSRFKGNFFLHRFSSDERGTILARVIYNIDKPQYILHIFVLDDIISHWKSILRASMEWKSLNFPCSPQMQALVESGNSWTMVYGKYWIQYLPRRRIFDYDVLLLQLHLDCYLQESLEEYEMNRYRVSQKQVHDFWT